MEKEKISLKDKLKAAAQEAKEKIGDVADKTSEQAKAFAVDAGEKIKDLKDKAQVIQHDAIIDLEKRNFCPVTLDDYNSINFNTPKLLRILESDIHEGHESCEGAIGYAPTIAKVKLFQIIKRNCDDIGMRFYPNKDGVIYYQNPYEKDMYLNIEDYFDFIKRKRVNELEMIANKLGASHVKITIKEEKKSFVSAGVKMKDSIKIGQKIDKASESEEKKGEVTSSQAITREIALDHEFKNPGNPEKPDLLYYKGDPDIESLIEIQFGKNPSKRKTYKLKFLQSSDINIDAAIGIDAVLSKLQLNSSASLKSEVEKEQRMFFEYFVEF